MRFAVGQVVEDHVRLVSSGLRHFVALVVPLAAGMEPLNPQLATAPPEAKTKGKLTLEPTYADYRDDYVAFLLQRAAGRHLRLLLPHPRHHRRHLRAAAGPRRADVRRRGLGPVAGRAAGGGAPALEAQLANDRRGPSLCGPPPRTADRRENPITARGFAPPPPRAAEAGTTHLWPSARFQHGLSGEPEGEPPRIPSPPPSAERG